MLMILTPVWCHFRRHQLDMVKHAHCDIKLIYSLDMIMILNISKRQQSKPRAGTNTVIIVIREKGLGHSHKNTKKKSLTIQNNELHNDKMYIPKLYSDKMNLLIKCIF